MNYHALAPKIYKRSVVCGIVHRIILAYSTWKSIHESSEKAKKLHFRTISTLHRFMARLLLCVKSIVKPENKEIDEPAKNESVEEKMIFLHIGGNLPISLNAH